MVPKGGTKYFVRLKASTLDAGDAVDPAAPPYPTFTTLPVDPPTIPGAVGVSEVFSHQVKLSGKVERPTNPDPAFDAQCRFEAINDTQFDENVTNIGPEAGFEGALVLGATRTPLWTPLSQQTSAPSRPGSTPAPPITCVSSLKTPPRGSGGQRRGNLHDPARGHRQTQSPCRP